MLVCIVSCGCTVWLSYGCPVVVWYMLSDVKFYRKYAAWTARLIHPSVRLMILSKAKDPLSDYQRVFRVIVC